MPEPQPLGTVTTKKMPTWAKVFIGLVIAFVIFVILGSVGFYLASRMVMNKLDDAGGIKNMIEKGIEKQIEKQTGQKTDIHLSENGLEVRDEKGEQKFAVGTGTTLPADFPKDVPVYQPSKVVSSMNMGGALMVNLETPSKPDQVSSFYQSQLASNGWKSSFNMASGEEGQMIIYNKENQTLSISIASAENGKTGFMITYGSADQKPVED